MSQRYTVKQVAKLSGASIRALRFYDEIGLLKPAYKGDNGYRYYENEQLLQLQQILFYRELEFPLEKIQKILSSRGFDKIQALQAHRVELQKDVERRGQLIRTIDKTIAQLKGEGTMKTTEYFLGFDAKKQRDYEQYLVDRFGKGAEEHIKASKERTKDWKKKDFDRVKIEGDKWGKEFANLIEQGLTVDDISVQAMVQRHYDNVCKFWTPNKVAYIGLGKLYGEHPDFRKYYGVYHPRMVEFLAEAITVFADRKL